MSKTTRIRYLPWLGTVSREVDTGVSEVETEQLKVGSEELVGGGIFFSCLRRRQPFAGQSGEQNLCFFIACICLVKLPPLPQSHNQSPVSGEHMLANLRRPASLSGRFHPTTFFVTIGPPEDVNCLELMEQTVEVVQLHVHYVSWAPLKTCRRVLVSDRQT